MNSVLVMMTPPASKYREVLARELHRCLLSQSFPFCATARHASQPLSIVQDLPHTPQSPTATHWVEIRF